MPLNDLIAPLLDARRGSVSRMARHCGVDKAAVSKWKVGKDVPDVGRATAIANFFKMDVEEVERAILCAEKARDGQRAATVAEARRLREENLRLEEEIRRLRERVAELERRRRPRGV